MITLEGDFKKYKKPMTLRKKIELICFKRFPQGIEQDFIDQILKEVKECVPKERPEIGKDKYEGIENCGFNQAIKDFLKNIEELK